MMDSEAEKEAESIETGAKSAGMDDDEEGERLPEIEPEVEPMAARN